MLSEYSYYYTLRDILNDWNIGAEDLDEMEGSIGMFLDHVNSIVEITVDDTVKLLLKKYIIPSTLNSIIDITAEEDVDHEDFLGRFAEWLNYSYDLYSPILLAYQDNKAKLMSSLVNTITSDSRASDTPEVQGEWDGNEQVSSISKSTTTSTSDPSTVMSRLREIQRDYRNIMREWCRDYQRRFCMEVIV